MMVSRGYAWMNGELVPQAEAALSVTTDAVLRGASVFEGIRAYRAAEDSDGGLLLFRLGDHLSRLFGVSMRFLQLELPYSPADVGAAIGTLLDANEITADTYVRVVVYIGEHGLGGGAEVPTGIFILASEGFRPAPESMRATLSPWRRMSDVAMPPRVKSSANYLNSRIATTDAQRKGFDTAILLNEHGRVAEGPAMNVFLVRDGQLVTPRPTDGILEGITRATVIDLARDLGIPVLERAVDATELYVADELFLCGTAYEIVPVREIDGYDVSGGVPGGVTERLQVEYQNMARGAQERHAEWLTLTPGSATRRDLRTPMVQ